MFPQAELITTAQFCPEALATIFQYELTNNWFVIDDTWQLLWKLKLFTQKIKLEMSLIDKLANDKRVRNSSSEASRPEKPRSYLLNTFFRAIFQARDLVALF